MVYVAYVEGCVYGLFGAAELADGWLKKNWPVAYAQKRTEVYPLVFLYDSEKPLDRDDKA